MYKVRVWPDGSWLGEDDWYTLAEDHSDDYFVLEIPEDVDDIEQYVEDNMQEGGW